MLSLKCFSINRMYNLPILVFTDWQNGGLKNMTFLLRFGFFLHCKCLSSVYFSLCLKLNFAKASWYIVNYSLYIFSFSDNLFLYHCWQFIFNNVWVVGVIVYVFYF